MKKKISWALGLLLLWGCAAPVELQKQTFTIELGKDVYANPALYVKDGKNYHTEDMSVVSVSRGIAKKENRFISLGKEYLVVGEYDFKIKNGSQEIPFRIKIKDTQPPTLTNTPKETSVAAGSVIDWDSVFEANDLSGVSYEAPLGITDAVGEQDIVVKITDRYGNKIEQPIKVIVHG